MNIKHDAGLKKRERRLWILLFTVSFSFNLFYAAKPVAANVEIYHQYQQVLQYVFHYLKSYHVEEKSDKELLIGAIRGMLAAAGDPYTRFLDHNEHNEFNNAEEGKKVGIGIEVTMRNGYPLVIAPIEGSPAAKAGIRAGDRIKAIDGKSIRGASFGKILNMIGGEIGTVVELEIIREGFRKPIKMRVTRGLFNLRYVKSELIAEDKIGYIRLLQFFGGQSGVVDKFVQRLEDFKRKDVKGIVVDLRNNTGGHLQLANVITGFFLKPGDVVVKVRGRDKTKEVIHRVAGAYAGIVPERVPVIVLINRGSASASEIMAGALQDHGRAKIMGERSFGKASVQRVFRPLPDDTAALITVQKYYTPKDRSLHGKGLTPDISVTEIKPTYDENYNLNKMQEAGFIKDFKKRHPEFRPELIDVFKKEAGEKGWKLSRPVTLRVIKHEYEANLPGKIDLESDRQLKRAVEEILK